jgi:hypothetical protein
VCGLVARENGDRFLQKGQVAQDKVIVFFFSSLQNLLRKIFAS